MSKITLVVLLSLFSCNGPDLAVAEFLVPDQLHVNNGQGYGSSIGDIDLKTGPLSYGTSSESDYWFWTAGFSWNLTAPPLNEELRQATIDLRLMSDLMQKQSKMPKEIVVVDPLITGWLGHLESVGNHDQEPKEQKKDDGESVRSFTQIMVALGVIATAISGWLGKQMMKSNETNEPQS